VNVNQVYQVVLYAAAKNLQDGYVSPQDFYTVINQAQRSYLDYLLGEYQKYQTRRPISPTVEFGQNEKVRTSLAPLIYGVLLTIDGTGLATNMPTDYEYPDAMWTSGGFYNIRFIQQDRLHSYYRSSIDPIGVNPVFLMNSDGLQFYPTNLTSSQMSYVRTPPSIVWGSTPDSNGIPTWNPATSQDPIWAETDMLQIIVRALALIGVNLQFGVVLQYANDVKNTGQ